MTDEIIAILDRWWWPGGESNSLKTNQAIPECYKETAVLWHCKSSPSSTNDTYLRRGNWNIIKFSVLIIIIITVEEIGIDY